MSLPATKVPSEQLKTLPSTTTIVMATIGSAYFKRSAGSISMPMETKNTALKRSRTGCMSVSIL